MIKRFFLLLLLTISTLFQPGDSASSQTSSGTVPVLSVSITSDDHVEISWASSASAYTLEESVALGDRAVWEPVSERPISRGGVLVVSLSLSGSTRFYRLRQSVTAASFRITKTEPLDGAVEVGVTFRPKITFSEPVNPASLTSASFYATAAGRELEASIVPANDGSFAWLFFKSAMPGGAKAKVTIDGSKILAEQGGAMLDPDGDGLPGGIAEFEFTTVSLQALPGTSLSGIVTDPGPDRIPRTPDDAEPGADGQMGTPDDRFLLPIAGATVFLLGREEQTLITGADGRFRFEAVPAGDVKVVVDGTTATSAPAGFYFPEMVIDAQMAPGIENHTMTNGAEVYLPRLSQKILQTVDSSSPTLIRTTVDGAQELSAFQRNQLTIELPANSLVGADGQKLSTGQVGISTVPPDLVREMLPPGILQHTFDITVQAPGVATFSQPAPMTFPNVFNAAPGMKLNFLSFDHTTGRLVIDGTATVSADGTNVRTDPGTGITHPGWHGLAPPGAPNDPPCNPTAEHDVDVDPNPVTDGVQNYFFKEDGRLITLSFGNAAPKQNPNEDPCSPANIRGTPLVITITWEGPVEEFLNTASVKPLILLPGQQGKIQIITKQLLTPERIAKAQKNVLYGAKFRIEGRKFNSTLVTYLDRTFYVYRLFDIADDNHSDGVDFEKAFRDGRGGIRQTRPLVLNMPDSVRPIFTVLDDSSTPLDERDDFFVETSAPNETRLVFDPVSGLDPVPGNTATFVEIKAPDNMAAGRFFVRGQGVSPQIILFPKIGFQRAMAALIDQNPLPALLRGVAGLFPPDGSDPGLLRSDEPGFQARLDAIYFQIVANLQQTFFDLSASAGANATALSIVDPGTAIFPGQFLFSTFFNTNLPGGTELCGSAALACATWADFSKNEFPAALANNLSLPEQRWIFGSLVNRSFSDPYSAIQPGGGGQALNIYLDRAAEVANADPTVFVPRVSNALVHEIGHNLGAIHLRSVARLYIWGDHDVMGLGEPDRHKLSTFRTFAPLIKFGLGLPVSDGEFKAILAYYKKYVPL